MKRKHDPSKPRGPKTGDIKADLSKDQLAGIGAAALAYNTVERKIDDLFRIAAGLHDPVALEVTTRINGIDGKIEIIKVGAAHLGFTQTEQTHLADALGEGIFGLFKKYRGAIIHTSVINAAIGIGVTIGSRAKVEEILLSKAALDAFYAHLIALRDELDSALKFLFVCRMIHDLDQKNPERAQYVTGREESSRLFLAHRAQRQSLPPIPEFPSEQEFAEAETRYHSQRAAVMLGWLQTATAPGWIHSYRQQRPRSAVFEPPYPPPEQEKKK